MKKRPVLALFLGLTILIFSARFDAPAGTALFALGPFLPLVRNAVFPGRKAGQNGSGRTDRRTERFVVFLPILLLLIGCVRIRAAWDPEPLEAAQDLAGRRLAMSGVIEDCERGEEKMVLTVQLTALEEKGKPLEISPDLSRVRFTLYEEAWIPPGSTFEMTGKLSVPDGKRNPGGFDYQNYLLARGIRLTASASETSEITLTGSSPTLYTRLRAFRMRLAERLYGVMDTREASLAGALLLGERVDSALQTDFQEAGLSHLLALSGLHVGLISAMLLFLVRPLPEKIGWTLVAAVLGIWLLLTGLSPSVFRAVTMFWIAGLARYGKKTYDLFTALVFLASLFLIVSPALLFDGGFLLSFGAVAGIALFNGPLNRKISRLLKLESGDEAPILAGLILSVSAGSLTFPLCLYLYGEQRLILYLANMLIVPLAPLLVLFALIVLLIPCGPTAGLFTFVADVISGAVGWLGNLPTLSFLSGAGAYFLSALWIFFLLGVCGYQSARTRKRRVFILSASAAAILFGLWLTFLDRSGLEIIYLDVGQGNAAIVSCEGVHILIDGGGYEDTTYARTPISEKVLLPALKAKGISRLDAAFISHAHEDHAQGVREVLSVMACDQVFVNPGWNDEAFLAGLQVPWKKLSRGMTIEAGGMTIEVLNPEDGENLPDDGQNENSLVLSLSYRGLSFLFPGDTGADTEAAILSREGSTPVMAALAAHHGSKYSNSNDFFELYRPEVFIISCGVNNRYGHPAPEVVARAEENGCTIFRTDEDGAVTLRLLADRLTIRSCLNRRTMARWL